MGVNHADVDQPQTGPTLADKLGMSYATLRKYAVRGEVFNGWLIKSRPLEGGEPLLYPGNTKRLFWAEKSGSVTPEQYERRIEILRDKNMAREKEVEELHQKVSDLETYTTEVDRLATDRLQRIKSLEQKIEQGTLPRDLEVAIQLVISERDEDSILTLTREYFSYINAK